jgi:hypothetical protein
MRAPYSPPAIRQWVQSQDIQPLNCDIDCQRFSRRRGIRQDNRDQSLSGNLSLHDHFCLNTEDRELAFYEGMSDIKDAVCIFLYAKIYYQLTVPTLGYRHGSHR